MVASMEEMKDWQKKHYQQMMKELEGVELTEKEHRFVKWLAGLDSYTVDNFSSIVVKLRS